MQRETTVNPSLPGIHQSIGTEHASFWKRLLAFSGPAYLVSVGYMDPGNWATDLEAGARFGYRLLWVLVASNLMAILLQTLSARLGIVSQRDLAQACRESYPPFVARCLWVLCEIAIAACDLAEVLGTAIALNLLFHLPLLWGVVLTAFDTLLILWFTRIGLRVIESIVLALVAVIGLCFFVEIAWAGPNAVQVFGGLVPRIGRETLFLAIGILGATVMPHNLYLHSALVQTRRIGTTQAEKRTACRFNMLDSLIALNGALLVNAAILVLAASVFFSHGVIVTEIQQAQALLSPLLGTAFAGVLFGVALLCSGQSSTVTGTLAGQIVMEGFINFRMRPSVRRLLTRSMAVIPAGLTIYFAGEQSSLQLIILSQVILSLQLPFAIVPLIHFTSDKERMGTFANPAWLKAAAWGAALVIITLNFYLIYVSVGDWWRASWYVLALLPVLLFMAGLLGWIAFQPMIVGRKRGLKPVTMPPAAVESGLNAAGAVTYRRILVPVDHSDLDQDAIANAVALSSAGTSCLYLLHVEEGVGSQVFGAMAANAETQAGEDYLRELARGLEDRGITVEVLVKHSRHVRREIIRSAREVGPDLIVMGAHGHKGWKDIIFGTTINAVRHHIDVPLLIVRKR